MNVSRQWTVEVVPIDSITPHPRNYREHDVGSITISIGRFGQYLPVVVQRSTNYIVAGSGRWKAQKARGETEIPVRFEDFTDQEALAVLIADNWIGTHRGRDMDPELLDLMQELREEEELFTAAGLEDDDIEALEREVAEQDEPLKLDSRKMMKKPKLQKIVCPECGHKFEIETRKGPRP